MKEEEKLLKSLVGQEYTPENARELKYGGIISSNGTIKRVLTRRDAERHLKRCRRLKEADAK